MFTVDVAGRMNMKKKVLHIMNSLLPSGAETMLYSAAKYWDKNLDIHILATGKNIGEYAEQLRMAGYQLHHIYNESYMMQHKKVRELIKKEKIDIVHIHRQGEACSYALDAKLAGASVIIRTVHNVFIFHGLVQVREYIARKLSALIGVKYVAISASVSENEMKRFGIKAVEIRNWYNNERFHFVTEEEKRAARKELGIENDMYCVVSVGNCSSVKNHFSILKAIATYKNDPYFQKVRYLHIGKGAQEDDEIQYVKEQNIQEYVHFYGFTDPMPYLEAADLFVMPSVYEGFGIAGIEGAATGIKTIFTMVPGLQDFKEIFPTIIYCKLDDEEIGKTIYKCVREGSTSNNKEQAEKIFESYGISDGVKQYERLYFGK